MVYTSIIETALTHTYELKTKSTIFLSVVDIEEFEKYAFSIHNPSKTL